MALCAIAEATGAVSARNPPGRNSAASPGAWATREQLSVDSAKQQTFLARLLEEQDQLAQRAVETLDWLQANPSPSAQPLVTPPNRGSDT
jgi:hypothetical protein